MLVSRVSEILKQLAKTINLSTYPKISKREMPQKLAKGRPVSSRQKRTSWYDTRFYVNTRSRMSRTLVLFSSQTGLGSLGQGAFWRVTWGPGKKAGWLDKSFYYGQYIFLGFCLLKLCPDWLMKLDRDRVFRTQNWLETKFSVDLLAFGGEVHTH